MRQHLFMLACLTLLFVACRKDEKPLPVSYKTIGGTWNLVSDICGSREYFNIYYADEWGASTMETSCNTEIAYTVYSLLLDRKLIIDNYQCWMEYTKLYQHPDYDSTYSSCELQCCDVDTDVVDYMGPTPFALNLDKKGFVLKLEFGNVSGAAHYYVLQEFSILKLTKDTLIFTGGGGPDIIALSNTQSCIYTFVR